VHTVWRLPRTLAPYRGPALLRIHSRDKPLSEALHARPRSVAPVRATASGSAAIDGIDRREEPDLGATTQILKLPFAASLPRVLIVDDDELVLARLQDLVASAGFEVATASSGTAAIASLREVFAPILIMDLKMPGMDGLAVCRAIRQGAWPGYVYIVLLTAQAAEDDILAGLDAGADDYMSKRTSLAQLLARLRTAQRILTLEQSLKEALAEKRRLSMTDELTGAPNRRYFQRRLSRELERMRRFGGELSVMSLDIDRFKQINDRYGHASGDAVLQEFVRRLERTLPRNTDWCARMGGEEFVVVLEETNLQGAKIMAERLRDIIAASPIRTRSGMINVTVSIGVSGLESVSDRHEVSVESLMSVADSCLYASKENGRNRVTLP
jgi:two-component system, cell cycle response regulator